MKMGPNPKHAARRNRRLSPLRPKLAIVLGIGFDRFEFKDTQANCLLAGSRAQR